MVTHAEIENAYVRARAEWPSVDVPFSHFTGRARDLSVSDDGLCGWPGDFYLACAAGSGDAAAIAIVNHRFVDGLAQRIRRLGATPDAAADALQSIRERLFTGSSPRIRAYNAAGPLEQWIKVVGIRTAIDLHRAQAARQPGAAAGSLDDTPAATIDPDRLLTKRQLKAEFEDILKRQLRTLSTRDRLVLRLHVVEGISIEQIALSQGVHRVTIARWIWSASERLLDALRHHFQDRHGMVPRECDSLAHLLHSDLSLDLPAVLAT